MSFFRDAPRSQFFLAGAILLAPLAIGGVHFVTTVVLAALALMGGALVVQECGRENTDLSLVVSMPSLALWLFALICLVQIIPLPEQLHRLFSPTGMQHFHVGWQLVFPEGGDTSWRALSLDPQRTADRGLRWLSLAMFSFVAANAVRSRKQWRHLLWFALFSGLFIWLIGVLQIYQGHELFLGFYQATIDVRTISTFVNANHAAAYYGALSLIGVGLALEGRGVPARRVVLASTLATLFFVLLMIHTSDAAVGFFSLGLCALVSSALSRQNHQVAGVLGALSKRVFGARYAAVIFFSAIILSIWFLYQRSVLVVENTALGQRLSTKGSGRWELVQGSVRAMWDYFTLGSGAGSIELVLYPYLDWTRLPLAAIETIENEPAEWLLTMGPLVTVVGCVLLLSGIFWCGWQAARKRGSTRTMLLLALSLFFFGISLFHFPFFALGLSVPWIILLEGGFSSLSRRGYTSGTAFFKRPHVRISHRKAFYLWGISLGLYLVYLIGFLGGYNHSMEDLVTDRNEIDHHLVAEVLHSTPTRSELYTRLALHAYQEQEFDRALELMEHSFSLQPLGDLRLYLAHFSARVGNIDQALRHYQEFFRGNDTGSDSLRWIERFLLQDLQDQDLRVRALSSAPREWWIDTVRVVFEREGPVEASAFALALEQAFPDVAEAHLAILEVYELQEEYLLVELWARRLIQRQLVTSGGYIAGYWYLAKSLAAQNREREKWDMLHEKSLEQLGSEEFQRWILSRRPQNPRVFREEKGVSLFENAYAVYCRQPIRLSRRQAECWRAQAWLHENRGEMDDAERIYQRMRRRLRDPRELGAFYLREGKCHRLERLWYEVKPDSSIPDHRKTILERQVQRCKDLQ